MIMKYLLAILSIILITCSVSHAQEVTTLIEKKEYQVNDQFTIGFKINSLIDSVHIPAFKGLTAIGGPSTSQSSMFNNGVSKSEFTLTYHLKINKKGRIKINTPIYFVQGKPFKGKAIKIKVSKAKKKVEKPEKKPVKGTHYS